MKIINPYKDIDFSTAVRVRGITHEHIFDTAKLKNAYDRGIRWFACVNYQPAVSAAPDLRGWSGTYSIWNYFDVSYAYPNGGSDGNGIFTSAEARAAVPNINNLHTTGLIIRYSSGDDTVSYEQFIGLNWSTDDAAWETITSSDLSERLTLKELTYTASTSIFTDSNGNEIDPSTLPAIGNAEHAIFRAPNGNVYTDHFNVLGNMFAEPCVITPLGYPRSFVNSHPIYNISDISSLFTQDLQFNGKYFGTLNHTYYVEQMERYIKFGDGLFKAVETFNQGATKERNQLFRNAYDYLLRRGYKLWNVAVVDWQGDIENSGYSGQDMSNYVKECDFDRGCVVLYMPDDYGSLSKSNKTEAGIDSLIAGTFYASGLGNHYIVDLSVTNGVVHFQVDGEPSEIKLITSRASFFYTGSEVNYKIEDGISYVRFEVYYYSNPVDMDFIFTNPIWIEDNNGKTSKNILILLE